MVKVSFLVPAHNEEKMIAGALKPLVKLKDQIPIEILVGLDGCTDSTEKVVDSFKGIKKTVFSKRRGKQAILNELIKQSLGEILIVNDADWNFVGNKKDLDKLIKCFNDPRVGGLGDHYAITFSEENVKNSQNALFLGDAWSTLFIAEFKAKKFAEQENGKTFARREKDMYPFFVNFFRKEVVGEQKTICDDGERMIQIHRKGLRVQLLPINSFPLLSANYDSIDWKGFYRQKFRGLIARKQINEVYNEFNPGFFGFYFPLFFYVICNLHRTGRIKAVFGVFLWWAFSFAALIGFLFSKKKFSSKEGWKMRYSR